MKKDEAISILATSARPREPKNRTRYDEAVKMAIEALRAQDVHDMNNGDTISRQAAIAALCKAGCNSEHCGISCDDVRAIEGLPSAQPERDIPRKPTVVTEYGWIPCSKKLPEKETRFYLTTIAKHGLNFTTTLPDDVDVVRWDYDRRKGHNSWHWCTERTVIAWMPLPESYKEGAQNEFERRWKTDRRDRYRNAGTHSASREY